MLASKLLGLRTKKFLVKAVTGRNLISINKTSSLNKIGSVYANRSKMQLNQRKFCALYYEKLYRQYLQDPNSVDEAWRLYFENKEAFNGAATSSLDVSTLADQIAQKIGSVSSAGGEQQSSDIIKIVNIVRAYQTVGHEKAQIDPLKLEETLGDVLQVGKVKQKNIARLSHKYYGFSDAQLDKEYYIDNTIHNGFLSLKKRWVLKDLINSLEKAYCDSIGVEFMHIQNTEE